MTMATDMRITLRLPTRKLFEGRATKLTAVAQNGAFGMLPNHIDFVTALVPSVLTVVSPDGQELFFGIDEGLLVKKGHDVDVAIRRGVQGDNLDTLHETVRDAFVEMDDEERTARSAISRLEANMVRRIAELRGPHP